MFLIGLTGGIAAGKTTVAKLWTDLGGIEIDADLVAREVVEPGTKGAKLIAESFGEELFDESGNLDRKALGAIVFSDVAKRKELEAIVHPLVRDRVRELLSSVPEDSMVIYTVPLLVEADVDLPFDVVVTVEAPDDVRIKRLMESRGYSALEAKARIDNQAKPIERAQRADYILNSNQSVDLLMADARKLWKELETKAAHK
jgi:dephospho-CoA kinase